MFQPPDFVGQEAQSAPTGNTRAGQSATLFDDLHDVVLRLHGIHMALNAIAHASSVSIVKEPKLLGAKTLSTQPFIVHKDGYRYLRIWPQVNTTITVEMPSGPMSLSLGPANAPALPIPDDARITAPTNVNVTIELTDYTA